MRGSQLRQASTDASTRQIRRVTWVGLGVNLLLSALKLAFGLIGHSQAVVADAVHSLSDMATDVAVLVGVQFWSAPADDDHPYGHARIETLVTLFIGAALAAVAVGIGYEGITSAGEEHLESPGLVALAAALVSIAAKEALYRWTAVVGRRVGSQAVLANAWHHRSDALSSIPAAIAVGAAAFRPEWAFVDHLGAAVVALFIMYAAGKICVPALGHLVDRGAPRAACVEIERIAAETPGVMSVHAVRTRYIGAMLQVDLHVQVDADISVRDGHDIAHGVKRRLIETGPGIADAVVHVEPFENRKPA